MQPIYENEKINIKKKKGYVCNQKKPEIKY
jgi:hypothetical protein